MLTNASKFWYQKYLLDIFEEMALAFKSINIIIRCTMMLSYATNTHTNMSVDLMPTALEMSFFMIVKLNVVYDIAYSCI